MISLQEIRDRRIKSLERIDAFFKDRSDSVITDDDLVQFLDEVLRTSPNVKFDLVRSLISERPEDLNLFLALLSHLPLAYLVECLFIIMSKKETCPRSRVACGRLLSLFITTQEEGLCIIVDFMSTPYSSGNIQLLEQISKIVLSIPKAYSLKQQEYINLIVEKISQRLFKAGKAEPYLYLLTKLVDFGTQETIKRLMHLCFYPLVVIYDAIVEYQGDDEMDVSGNLIVVPELSVEASLHLLESLLSFSATPKCAARLLKTLGCPLLHFYVTSKLRRSGLISRIETIFRCLFKLCNVSDMLWYFDSLSDLAHRSSEKVKITSGSEGGLMVVENDFVLDDGLEDILGDLFRCIFSLASENEESQCYVLNHRYSSLELLAVPESELLLLQTLFEELQPAYLKYPSALVDLLSNLLEKNSNQDNELVMIVLTLLTSILANPSPSFKLEEAKLKRLLRVMESYSCKDKPDVFSLMQRLQESVNLKLYQADEKLQNDTELDSQFKLALTEISGSSDDVVIRSHGIHILRELALKKSDAIKNNLSRVKTLVLGCLAEPDSFLYLNAIKCLSALADAYSQEIIPELFEVYANDSKYLVEVDCMETVKQNPRIAFRLRIGEALLQVTQRLGSALDVMAPYILKSIFKVIKNDDDKEMKASALSLLSAIAEVSPLSLRFELFNIVKFCHDCVALEKHVSMRRGKV